LYIPDSAKERATQATVVAVGKGRTLQDGSVIELKVKAGDTVLFGKYAGNEIKLDGEELLLMREDVILAGAPPPRVGRIDGRRQIVAADRGGRWW